MEISEVIRKYRKAKGLTQEEMASYLGVSTSAVNKWENGNTMPDLTLIAPIARLLDVSLNELLSFQEELTEKEVEKLIKEAEQKFLTEDYNDVFIWIKEQVKRYPNSDSLILGLIAQLEGNRLMKGLQEDEQVDMFIVRWYEHLLKSNDETIKMVSANALYHHYFRKNQYEQAEQCLSFFSIQNPERKRKLAELYEKKGDLEKAYQTYEEILMAEYQIVSLVLNSLFILQLQNNKFDTAKYYADKMKLLVQLFDMGEYNLYVTDLDLVKAKKDQEQTLDCAKALLNSLDSIRSFTQSPLYAHIKFKDIDVTFKEMIKNNLVDCFQSDDFDYMHGNSKWEELLLKF